MASSAVCRRRVVQYASTVVVICQNGRQVLHDYSELRADSHALGAEVRSGWAYSAIRRIAIVIDFVAAQIYRGCVPVDLAVWLTDPIVHVTSIVPFPLNSI